MSDVWVEPSRNQRGQTHSDLDLSLHFLQDAFHRIIFVSMTDGIRSQIRAAQEYCLSSLSQILRRKRAVLRRNTYTQHTQLTHSFASARLTGLVFYIHTRLCFSTERAGHSVSMKSLARRSLKLQSVISNQIQLNIQSKTNRLIGLKCGLVHCLNRVWRSGSPQRTFEQHNNLFPHQ